MVCRVAVPACLSIHLPVCRLLHMLALCRADGSRSFTISPLSCHRTGTVARRVFSLRLVVDKCLDRDIPCPKRNPSRLAASMCLQSRHAVTAVSGTGPASAFGLRPAKVEGKHGPITDEGLRKSCSSFSTELVETISLCWVQVLYHVRATWC